MAADKDQIRELFIEDLEKVHGGGPVEELIEKLKPGPSTEACCEEGPDACCKDPW